MNTEEGLVTYFGRRYTIINYMSAERKWVMYLANNNNTRAESKADLQTFVMGHNIWTIKNDYECSLTDVETVLSLTTCGPDKYTCNNGLCIDISKRCDSWPDCGDKSDELNCRRVNIGKTYQKHITPPGKGGSGKVRVNVSMDLISIININEVDSIFEVQFTLYLSWLDSRMSFNNLKNDTGQNVLSPKKKSMIWLPKLVFLNTKSRPKVTLIEETNIMVKKQGSFELSSITELENIQVYSGSENPLILSQFYNMRFLCNYEMQWVPFNIQKCTMILANQVSMATLKEAEDNKLNAFHTHAYCKILRK